MSWDEFLNFMQNFRTDQVVAQLQAWNVGDLGNNPWVLGTFAAAILITYFLGWKAISGFIVGIGGFALMLSYAVQGGTGTQGIEGGGIWVVVGGGGVIAILFIYLLFIKSD